LHQGNGRATTSVEKAHGNYEHCSGQSSPGELRSWVSGCHSADMVVVTNDVGWVVSEGKDLFRQRGCVGCHRFEGYDKEPNLISVPSRSSSSIKKKGHIKQPAI